jgi:NAD(P)H-quinone oxidoreductase subunit 4L
VQNVVTVKEPQSSINLALVYALVAAAVVGSYTGQLSTAAGIESIVTNHYDFWACLGLALAGWIFRSVGGHKGVIVTMTVLASFIILTLSQPMLLRYLTFAALLFSMGLYGMVQSRNAVRVLLSIELMLNAVNINLIAFSRYVDPVALKGQLFVIFVLTVAAAEAAVGLAVVLAIYRSRQTVDMDKFTLLKW